MANSESNDLNKVPLIALRSKTRCCISQMLNSTKIIPSPINGLPRDWRGLSQIANVPLPPISSCDPTNTILESWGRSEASFENLLQAFKDLDRWDIFYDTISSIESDATNYFNSKDNGEVVGADLELDKIIITVDDVKLRQKGLELQIYDAFLLYSEADSEFAMEVVDKLENEYNLKLCLKDRDLVAGITFQHEAVMRLISDRCRRLIIIVSPSFLDSPANKFFLSFAQAIGIEQGQRKIIPCIYKTFPLPHQLRYYYVLNYTRRSQWWDFWKILSKSVSAIPAVAASSKKDICITEITADTENVAIDISKPEKWDCPEKSNNEFKKPIEEKTLLKCSTDDYNKTSVPMNSMTDTTKSNGKTSTKHSLFKKVIPKSLRGKHRSKSEFKKKKTAVALAN